MEAFSRGDFGTLRNIFAPDAIIQGVARAAAILAERAANNLPPVSVMVPIVDAQPVGETTICEVQR